MELVVIIVFVMMVAGVLLLALASLFTFRLPLGPRLRFSRGCVLLAAGLGLGCMAYGWRVEPYWPQVTHVTLRSSKLQGPVRLVQLSDLHCEARPRLEERLPGLVAAELPDIIVFTGDALNAPEGLPTFQKLVGQLAAIAPTYAVKGNWDAWYWHDLPLFLGAHELDGDYAEVEVRGEKLVLAGAAIEHEGSLDKLVASLPDGFSVLLFHYPDEIYRVQGKVDLYCAGHTHGGQVALPGYGALVTFSRFGKRFESGLYEVGGTHLYVNRGIGMEGGEAPRVRFWARPEITVFDLVPG